MREPSRPASVSTVVDADQSIPGPAQGSIDAVLRACADARILVSPLGLLMPLT
jgi:hypothetical protein